MLNKGISYRVNKNKQRAKYNSLWFKEFLIKFSYYRLETSVTDEQLRKQVVTEEVVQAELEAQRRLLDVEHQRKMAGIREEMENEVMKD